MKRVACLLLLLGRSAFADVAGAASASVQLFAEPAPSERMIVVTPSVTANAKLPYVEVQAAWAADVVTGATMRTYGRGGTGLDVITNATHMSEVRDQVLLGARAPLPHTPLTVEAAYRYSTESDYRSHMLRLGLSADLRRLDAQLTLRWAHDFDSICDLDNGTANALSRQPLGTSRGCFAHHAGLVDKALNIDGAEIDFQKVLTAHLKLGVDLFYAHLAGFQSNPYRMVALDDDQIVAQESHPTIRDRFSFGLALRWAPATIRGALGADVHLYRDTWAIESIAVELSWSELHLDDRLRWRVHARYYQQSAAFFYRDAGWADSYERAGPVGGYFTGDRQNAPLADLTVGAALHGQFFAREKADSPAPPPRSVGLAGRGQSFCAIPRSSESRTDYRSGRRCGS